MDTTPGAPQLSEGKKLSEGDLAAIAVQFDLFGAHTEIVVPKYEIVDAPVGELVSTELPRTFHKSNAVVSGQTIKGNYSLMMRRLFNAILGLSWTRVKTMSPQELHDVYMQQKVIRFESSGADIKRLIGWERSGDYTGIYEGLDALQGLKFKWDTKAEDGKTWTESNALLSQWGRRGDNGKIAWSWMPDMFALLFDPDKPYTPMDLALLRSFNSKYTLALFENCFRWRKIGATPWRAARDWVLLIAGPDVYKGFGEFNRTALKPSIIEINNTPDCPVTVEVEEKHGRYNRVEQLRFRIQFKKQSPLGLSLPADFDQDFYDRLKKLGLTEAKIRQLILEHDVAYLKEQLKATYKEVAKGQVENPPGYFIWRVENRYQVQLASDEELIQKVLDERKSRDSVTAGDTAKADIRNIALAWYAALSAEEQARLFKEFIDNAPFPVVRAYSKKNDKNHKQVETSWHIWLAVRPEVVQFGLN